MLNVYHVIFLILSHASLWEQSVKSYSGTQVPADLKISRAFHSMHDIFKRWHVNVTHLQIYYT